MKITQVDDNTALILSSPAIIHGESVGTVGDIQSLKVRPPLVALPALNRYQEFNYGTIVVVNMLLY